MTTPFFTSGEFWEMWVPAWSFASLRICRASSSVLPATSGTVTFSGPKETTSLTVLFSGMLWPAAGSVEIALPSSTSALYVSSVVTSNP